MLTKAQLLGSFLEEAAKEKTITDKEILEQTAGIPDADLDEIYEALTSAGVQVVSGDTESIEDPLEEADSPEADWDGGSMDSLSMYLHEIGQYPVLTQDKERDLSKAVVEGRAAEQELAGKKRLSQAKRAELEARVKAGKRAKEKLVECNLRFVVYLARSYQTKGLHLLDLIQSGNIGLMKGVDRYDPEKGFRLTTYVGWWIRQSIIRDIANTGRAVRLPVHVSERARKARAAADKFLAAGITDYSDEELAEAAGLSADELLLLRQATQAPVSLNTPVGDEDGDSTLIDMLADNAEGPDAAIEHEALHDALTAVMERVLSEKERMVLTMRMGLDGKESKTLEQVGQMLNVTRERVRQIEAKALRKMKNTPHKKAYLDFVDPSVLRRDF